MFAYVCVVYFLTIRMHKYLIDNHIVEYHRCVPQICAALRVDMGSIDFSAVRVPIPAIVDFVSGRPILPRESSRPHRLRVVSLVPLHLVHPDCHVDL